MNHVVYGIDFQFASYNNISAGCFCLIFSPNGLLAIDLSNSNLRLCLAQKPTHTLNDDDTTDTSTGPSQPTESNSSGSAQPRKGAFCVLV